LLDSNSKKTRFVQQAVAELGLTNVQVVQERAEDFRPHRLFDVVISRAFASVADMLKNSGQHCAENGVILAMKGTDPVDELKDIPEDFTVEAVYPVNVPGLEGERHVVCLAPVTGKPVGL
jgi:16S rRNA (guanine527-N7)-methyltransferase